MAKDKKGFILYADQKAIFEQLPNDKAGELIKFIFSYVNDENPVTDDLIIKLGFTPIQQQLKRDLVKYEETKEKRSEAGKAGANKRWQTIANDSKRINDIAKIADNVNDNVKDKEYIDFQALLEVINFSFSRKFEMINEVTQKKFNKLLKDGYKKQNILFAIKNCVNDTFHKENNYKYCTPDYFARPKTIDMYGNDLPIGIVEEKNANNTFAWDR
ncbi:MAG: DUF6291 domain-containing protein [Flavobacterium sp.]